MLLDINDPQRMGLLSLGLRLMSTPGKFGAALGQSGLGALGDMQQIAAQREAKNTRDLQQQVLMQQLEQAKALQAAKKAQEARQAKDEGLLRQMTMGAPMDGMGPPSFQPQLDPATFMANGGSMQGLPAMLQLQAALAPKPKKLMTVSPGQTVIDEADPTKPLFSAPPKPASKPSSVQEFEYGLENPAYNAWDQGRRRASATNIGLPKIEVKTGESVAGQVGAMAKDSKIKVGGAITMFDAADRIEKALDSNLVTSGPFASKIQTVKQLVQVIGGGNDEGIRQTQQVIRGLAKMAVEARKQLQGQGQITDNEAAAVLKADAGDIDSMTTGELRDLVTLTKRAAHFSAMEHKGIIDTMQASEATRGLVPYYQVRGMDSLLNYSPVLPQIGGSGDVRSQADQIIRRGP